MATLYEESIKTLLKEKTEKLEEIKKLSDQKLGLLERIYVKKTLERLQKDIDHLKAEMTRYNKGMEASAFRGAGKTAVQKAHGGH